MIRRTLPILLMILLAGCNQESGASKEPGEHRGSYPGDAHPIY